MHHKKQKNKEQPQPSFRNTRSKFYKKKQSDFDDSFQKNNSEENTGNYWKQKGNSQFNLGNIQKAIQYYSKAIEKNPSQSIYFSNRAKCYKKIGLLDMALKDAEQACELDSNNIKANYLCGCILAEIGKIDFSKLAKSQNRLKKALRLCSTLKKNQFEQQISIKTYRLKKMAWYIQREMQVEQMKTQKKLIQSLSQNNTEKIQTLTFIEKKIISLYKDGQIPDHLCCKITLQLMQDPVTTEEGHTYERSALDDHIKTNGLTDPISRKELKGKIYPNVALRAAVQHFLSQNPWAFQHSHEQNYLNIQF